MKGGSGEVLCGGITELGGSGSTASTARPGGNEIACDDRVADGRLTKKGGCV